MSAPPLHAIVMISAASAALPPAAAQAQSAAGQSSFFGELLSIVVPLAFIILVLFVFLKLVRRRFSPAGQDAPLSVVQILPLGPRERIVLLKTRSGRVFAVGVTGQSLNLITDLDPADLAPLSTSQATAEVPASRGKVFGLPLMRRDMFKGRRGESHSAD